MTFVALQLTFGQMDKCFVSWLCLSISKCMPRSDYLYRVCYIMFFFILFPSLFLIYFSQTPVLHRYDMFYEDGVIGEFQQKDNFLLFIATIFCCDDIFGFIRTRVSDIFWGSSQKLRIKIPWLSEQDKILKARLILQSRELFVF